MTATDEVRTRPILFSGEMVRAILDGRKTQTRRVVNPNGGAERFLATDDSAPDAMRNLSPYGKPGDRLWVRETLTRSGGLIQYAADHRTSLRPWPVPEWKQDPRPSIHMPRWASRITLELSEVRVERLQQITREDALAEGVDDFLGGQYFDGYLDVPAPVANFRRLWDKLNAERGFDWTSNPWLWVLSFTAKVAA